MLFDTLKSLRFSDHLLRVLASLSKLQSDKNIVLDALEKQVVMRVTLDSFRPSSQLMKNSQRQNRNQHSETTCLLISNVRALLRTLKNDRKTREMKQNEKSQTLSSNESESSFKKARRSRVKLSSKTFVTDSCFENDDEEKNFDDVAITRSATSQKKQQLRISKMSDRQSRIVFEFQTT